MGTSQSLKLKTTPNWASAKRAMTTIVQHRNEVNQQHVNNLLRNEARAIIHDSNSSYGSSGGRVTKNFIKFISTVRNNGLAAYVEQENPDLELGDLSVKDLLVLIKRHVSNPDPNSDHSTLDDIAARTAFEKLVGTIFTDVETTGDIENILLNATDEQLEGWMIEFQVEYIMELNGILFETQIFSKGVDPDQIATQIRGFIRVKINETCLDQLHNVNLFSPEGEHYLESLTHQIMEIWVQE